MVIMAETVSVAMSAGINFSVPHCAPAIPAIKIREQTIVKFVLYAMFCATKVLYAIAAVSPTMSTDAMIVARGIVIHEIAVMMVARRNTMQIMKMTTCGKCRCRSSLVDRPDCFMMQPT